MNKSRKSRSLISVLKQASLIGLSITFVITWILVTALGTYDSVNNKISEASASIRFAAISIEASDSSHSIRRFITKIGANRTLSEVYLIEKQTFKTIISSQALPSPESNLKLKQNLETILASKNNHSSIFNSIRSREVTSVEEIVIEKFSDRDLASGQYLLVATFNLNIFDRHLIEQLAIYTIALVLTLGLLLLIQRSILKQFFLDSFHVFIKNLKHWDEKSMEEIKKISGNGEIIELKDSFLDLNQKMETERSKATHNSKLASLGEMAAGIAHEVNNPLAIITGNLSLLSKRKEDEDKFNQSVATIERACLRIEKIVKSLRKFSRTSENKVRKSENIGDLVKEVLSFVEIKAKNNSIQINLQMEDDLYIFCDQIEIEQVVVNLLNNAIYAAKTSQDPWITIKSFKRNEDVVLQIHDSGQGISKLHKSKLFQPFFTTKNVGEGTGLGLSISKGILEAHGASISINETFSNTCFEIVFPSSNAAKSDTAA